MNMNMKNILIRIIMDLINLKILKQHLLVLQKKTSIRSTTHPTTDEISIKENEQTSHATEMSTAESTKHYLR